MKEYSVTVSVAGLATYIVEANNEKEAFNIALNNSDGYDGILDVDILDTTKTADIKEL